MNSLSPERAQLHQRVEGLLMASVNDSVLMMSVELGHYFSLNPVGSRIWELLETPKTLDEIVESLTAEFDVSVETAQAEAGTFLARLKSEGLLRPTSDSADRS